MYIYLGTYGAQDQANAVKYILNNSPYINPNKVCVWGWSGGGSMTLNTLFRYPDIYTCGVSVAPVPDMRLYDTIYQERYMDTPSNNEYGYKHGSPISHVYNMKNTQRLLLVHGMYIIYNSVINIPLLCTRYHYEYIYICRYWR